MQALQQDFEQRFGAKLSLDFHKAQYDDTMDFLEYQKEDKIAVSERVDGFLTLILDARTKEAIGFRMKGFRCAFQTAMPLLTENNFLVLQRALLWWVGTQGDQLVADQARLSKYKQAIALAESEKALSPTLPLAA